MEPLPAKKSLGQNFLKSRKALQAMVTSACVEASDYIVEVGPGKGALTQPLLKTGAHVIACELDPRMIMYLTEQYASYIESGHLILIEGDILSCDFETYLDGHSYKVVANLPYYITNRILRFFLSRDQQPELMTLLVQKEVAERITLRNNKTSILSLSVALYGTPHWIMKVPSEYFSPRPKVDSAIICIDGIGRTTIPSTAWEENFFTIIKQAFAQKRKQAIKNLEKLAPRTQWGVWFDDCHISREARAEDISLSSWRLLSTAFSSWMDE